MDSIKLKTLDRLIKEIKTISIGEDVEVLDHKLRELYYLGYVNALRVLEVNLSSVSRGTVDKDSIFNYIKEEIMSKLDWVSEQKEPENKLN